MREIIRLKCDGYSLAVHGSENVCERWYDTHPMIDEFKNAIDMATLAASSGDLDEFGRHIDTVVSTNDGFVMHNAGLIGIDDFSSHLGMYALKSYLRKGFADPVRVNRFLEEYVGAYRE